MQNLQQLPSSSVIFNYLSQDCLTEDIEIEILEKISRTVENCLFNRSEIEQSIKKLNLSIGILKILDIGYTLKRCVQGEPPSISLVKRKNKPLEKTKIDFIGNSTEIPAYISRDITSGLAKKLPGKNDESGLHKLILIQNFANECKAPVEKNSSTKIIDIKNTSNIITPRFPQLYERLGIRVGSFNQLCAKISHQIEENNRHAIQQDSRSKIHLEYFTKVQYAYKNGIIYLDHDPLRKVVIIKAEDLPEKVVIKLQEVIKKYNLIIEDFSTHSSSYEEYVMRIKKELCNHTYYSYTVDSSMTISDSPESDSGYVIKWKNVKDLTLDEVRVLSWGSKYLDINWKTLDVEKMSESFIREFSNQVNWFRIAKKQETLSKSFKSEFKDKFEIV